MANPPPSDLQDLPPDSTLEKLMRADSRLRARDSIGALKLEDVKADAAYTLGHAHGFEEAREDALDSTRTTLLAMLEKKFGEVGDEILEKIELADQPTLRECFLALLDAESAADVFPNG